MLTITVGLVLMIVAELLGWRGSDDQTFRKLLIGLVAFQSACFAISHWFLRLHGHGWRRGFSIRWDLRDVAWGLAVAAMAIVVGYSIEYGTFRLLRALGHSPEPQAAVLFLASAPSWQRAVIGTLAVMPAAVAEEAIFRGVLFTAIRDLGRPRLAIVVTALLFGLAHLHLPAFLPLTLLGAGLAWSYERTGNLATPIAAHAAYNLVGLVVAISGIGLDRTPQP